MKNISHFFWFGVVFFSFVGVILGSLKIVSSFLEPGIQLSRSQNYEKKYVLGDISLIFLFWGVFLSYVGSFLLFSKIVNPFFKPVVKFGRAHNCVEKSEKLDKPIIK